MTNLVSLESRALALPHGDPVDWLIVAAARANGLTLATADAALLESGVVACFPNR